MELNKKLCYRAVLSRDRRFDGKFFTAVLTTGIYCRPICPATPPRLRNVRFFACAAAAENAGYRPCRRCHPEASPGTPAWTGCSATVGRALRLISRGGLDQGNLDSFAGRLGVGSRHLRRLFARQLGASPGAISRCRRVHFARNLVVETGLPMAQIAFSSGFSSIRQFNHAFRMTFGLPPSAFRRKPGRPAPEGNGPVLRLRLPYRPPYDWKGLLEFIRPRLSPGVERVDGGSYRRLVSLQNSIGVIEVRSVRPDGLELSVPVAAAPELLSIVERVRRFFDLDADLPQIGGHLEQDPLLAPAVEAAPGLRIPGCWSRFELAVRAILGQQVTVRGATQLMGRLIEAFGDTRSGGSRSGLNRLFPSAKTLAGSDLSVIGIPAVRARAISQLASEVEGGRIPMEDTPDLEEAVTRLTRIPGIGEWTAHYIAMRAFGEPDAFPAADLGLRRALKTRSGLPSARELWKRAERWRPWRADATFFLWTQEIRRQKERSETENARNGRKRVRPGKTLPGIS